MVYCKATEGNYLRMTTFASNFSQLKALGIRRGAYHFHRKSVSAISQADFFVNTVRSVIEPGDFLVLDVEEGKETSAQLLSWISRVESQLPNEILIYSSDEQLKTVLYDPNHAKLKQYRTIMAGYPTFPDNHATMPLGYYPDPTKWGETIIWQYSGKGRVGGVSADIDLNVPMEKFSIEMGWNTTPPPTGDDMQAYVLTPATSSLRVRSAPNTSASQIGGIYQGDTVYATVDTVSGWLKISYIVRANQSEVNYGPSAYCSGNAEYIVPVAAPPAADEITLDVVLRDVKVAGDRYEALNIKAKKVA
jgi:GH25 family lysozyme M1 (1,4-beta-N-acetylmuramidase)